MEKIKKISAALIAMTMACSMMASCGGDEDTSGDSKGDTTSKAAADDNAAGDDAEGEGDAAGEGDASEESKADAPEEPFEYYTPQHEFQGYDAFLMFTNNDWLWANWVGSGEVHADDFSGGADEYGYGIDADIVGDGEYTVSITKNAIVGNEEFVNPNIALDGNVPAEGGSMGTHVFCIDIIGLMSGDEITGTDEETGELVNKPTDSNPLSDGDNHYNTGVKGDYNPSDITVTVTSIKCDGVEIDFDASKIKAGNIEDKNNCYRIEIYNDYGLTVSDPPFDPFNLFFEESLEVTFTIEGLGEVKQFPEVTPFGAAADEGDAAADEEAADGEEAADEDAAPEEDAAADEEAAE